MRWRRQGDGTSDGRSGRWKNVPAMAKWSDWGLRQYMLTTMCHLLGATIYWMKWHYDGGCILCIFHSWNQLIFWWCRCYYRTWKLLSTTRRDNRVEADFELDICGRWKSRYGYGSFCASNELIQHVIKCKCSMTYFMLSEYTSLDNRFLWSGNRLSMRRKTRQITWFFQHWLSDPIHNK